MFFFKNKEIVLDCFTDSKFTLENFPISKSENFYPEWWKNLPKEYNEGNNFWPTSTVKRCRGIIDFYNNSYTIPLWSDLMVSVENQNIKSFRWQFASKGCDAVSHSSTQRGEWLKESHGHLKLASPWLIKCKEEIKFSWISDFYNFNHNWPISIMPGVIDFKVNNATNINLLIKYPEIYKNEFLIPAGHPMINLRPHSERSIKIQLHLIDSTELDSMKTIPVFTNFYNFKKNLTTN
jgi:hypothetical protein